jgi:bifunctional NMN adenylyltransferase/nudix hydrolase
MFEYAVYIGRFQPFHTAHLESVRFALNQAKKAVVVIGSACGARNVKNPWSAAERIAMIRACLTAEENERVSFVLAKDYLYNDNMWKAALQAMIGEATNQSKNVVLIGHKKDASSFYLKLFKQWKTMETGVKSPVDATKVRDLLFRQDKIGVAHLVPKEVYEMLVNYMGTPEYTRLHEEFHHIEAYKAEWHCAPFPPTFNTVDAIVICSGHVLVVRRKGAPGRGLIALPGGYMNAHEGIQEACLRELKEETEIKLSYSKLSDCIVEEKTFGHPARSLRGRTITHAFCIDLGDIELPEVKGSDDAEKAWWMQLRDVNTNESEFFDDHFHIINFFSSRR